MALINCPECNKEVSDKAEVCPNCGFGVAKSVIRQKKIEKIQEEAEKEAYLYVKQKKKAEKEAAEGKKREEDNRKNSIYDEAVSKFTSESSKDVEKAEKLFSTISEWKDSSTYLSKCKERISELEALQEENCKKRNKKIFFATVITGICVGLIIGGYTFYKMVIVPRNIYESAMHSIQNGDYEDAIKQLETIIDYKDTEQQIEIASEGIYERDYTNAKRLVAEQKYSEASEILKNMENKDDVAELITLCDVALKYEKGMDAYEKLEYELAITFFNESLGYKDSEEMITLCDAALKYEKGMDAYEKLEYELAITFFNESLGYKDSEEMIAKAKNVYYIDDATRNLMDGYWYKPKDDDRGGRVIAINTSEQVCKLWTGWDRPYTIEYIKEDQEKFALKRTYASDSIINNGNGTYSILSKDREGNKIRFFTFEVTGNSLKIISVFYPAWESEIGIYSKVK